MPQMRAMSDGISWNGRPSQKRSKPRNWVTWKWASATWPCVVEVDGDLGVPLDAGHGVDDDLAGHSLGLQFSAEAGAVRGVRHAPLQQLDERAVDEVGRRRAAGQEDVDLDDLVDRHGPRQQLGHDLGTAAAVERDVLEVGALAAAAAGPSGLRMPGTLRGDRAVAERRPGSWSARGSSGSCPGRPRWRPPPRPGRRPRPRGTPWRRPAGCRPGRPARPARSAARRGRGTTCGSRSSRPARRWRA